MPIIKLKHHVVPSANSASDGGSKKPKKPKKPTKTKPITPRIIAEIETYFGTLITYEDSADFVAEFKPTQTVDLDENGTTEREALETLCDTLESIASNARMNMNEYLAKKGI